MIARIWCSTLAVAGLLYAGAAWSSQTRIWSERPETLRRGEAQGVALTAAGVVFPAPRLIRLGEGRMPGQPEQVWSITEDGAGNLFLGTGSAGQIIRVTPTGQASLFYTVDEPLVSALAIDRSGHLLAGTSPGGKIYRILPDGTGSLWAETGERYVWDIAVASEGAVYAATGERGTVLEVSAGGNVSPFFDSDEPHVVALIATEDGGLLAGGSGRGLVYRIDAEGNGVVLYEDELPEATALATDESGNVLVALVAPPQPESEPPALRLRLPDGVEVGRTDENVGRLEESTGPVLRGYIEGLPEGAKKSPTRIRGRVVRLAPAGQVERLWESTGEAPFSLYGSRSEIVFGTGEPARLYRVRSDGDVTMLATLREGQVTAVISTRRAFVFATSNPAAAYQLGNSVAEVATFVSDPFDAGGLARWGAIRWTVSGEEEGGRVEIYTRTGNSRDPDGTWSAWGPAMTDARRSRVVNPDGRYLQWRARFVGSAPESSRLSSVTVRYEPFNRAPRVRDLRLDEGSRWVAGDAVVLWQMSDPDDDPLEATLEYRARMDGNWVPVPIPSDGSPGAPSGSAGWTERRFEWDTSSVAEGEYVVRIVVSDRAVNTAAEGRTATATNVLPLVVDRTPPDFELSAVGPGRYELTLEDAGSEIRLLQLVADGRPLHAIRPLDGVCDSPRESFRIELPEATGELLLRGADAAGNHVEIPLGP